VILLSRHPTAPAVEAAETVALTALAYLLEDDDRSSRFLRVTGLAGSELAGHLADAAFLGGILDFVLDDEALLGGVAAATGLPPEAVRRARWRLPGASPEA